MCLPAFTNFWDSFAHPVKVQLASDRNLSDAHTDFSAPDTAHLAGSKAFQKFTTLCLSDRSAIPDHLEFTRLQLIPKLVGLPENDLWRRSHCACGLHSANPHDLIAKV